MKKNNKAYSVIIALLITWFLLLLVSWVFNLVLREFNDTVAMGNYYKAYYWAESSQELALLKIKEKWYWIDENIDFWINDKSIILSKNPTDKSLFNPKNEVFISYSLETKTNSYSWKLIALEYDIIPLFYIDNNNNEHKINNLDFNVNFWNNSELLWNIVSKEWWISWIWEFDWNLNVNKKISNSYISVNSSDDLKTFLSDNNTNYLILFNSWNNNIEYNLNTINNSEFFSKPKTYIISSAKIWDYRQNLRTYLNNTEYLNILKYSIYSN